MASYMFNEKVIIQQTAFNEKNELRVIEVDAFNKMLKATTIFLAAMNIRNKMWNHYGEEQVPKGNETSNAKHVTVNLMQEMQRLAKPASGRVIENGQ